MLVAYELGEFGQVIQRMVSYTSFSLPASHDKRMKFHFTANYKRCELEVFLYSVLKLFTGFANAALIA